MITLLIFSFLAGFITILAPCIWPLLPIIFSASSAGGRLRSLGLTLGVMTSFIIFTLFISSLIKIVPIDPNHLRLVATVMIGVMGVFLLIPSWGARFEVVMNGLLGPLQTRFKKEGSGFIAGLVTGFSLGLVWAPCAGPVLATIAALAATQTVNAQVVAITLAYGVGLGIPLYIFSFFSGKLFSRMKTVNKHTGRIQQFLGLVMILMAVLIYTNYDKAIQVKVLNLFPGYSHFLGQFENNQYLQKELDKLTGRQEQVLKVAPDFKGISQWLNSPALSLNDLKGKVVLVDFWTYSCINCVRTLPHLSAWHERYKDEGLVIVGVHTPEFAFERDTKNVANALKQFNITYPIAQDNEYQTWKNYQNRYWPAKYLIDAKGHIRYTRFGEGHYEKTEEAIRALLKENGKNIQGPVTTLKDQTPKYKRTPETYLGLRRRTRFVSPEQELALHHFAYHGQWKMKAQSAVSGLNAALVFRFKADKVFLVIGPARAKDRVKVFVDGQQMPDIVLDTHRLYDIIDLEGEVREHTLRLEFPNLSTAVYAFTFG